MKRIRIMILVIMSTCLLLTFDLQSTFGKTFENKVSLNSYFTKGTHNASVMEISLPPNIAIRINEIYQKLQTAVKSDQAWFVKYSSQYINSGQSMPWNSKFGITKDEYNELITSQDKMILTAKKAIKLVITDQGNGILTIKSNKDLPYLSNFKIDVKNNNFKNSTGTYKFSNVVKASDDQKTTGRWNGGTWKLNFSELVDINNIDANKTYGDIAISVGKFEKTKKVILYYRESMIKNRTKYKGEEIIVINN